MMLCFWRFDEFAKLDCHTYLDSFLAHEEPGIVRVACGFASGIAVHEIAKKRFGDSRTQIEKLAEIYLETEDGEIQRNATNALRFIAENKESLKVVGASLKSSAEHCVRILGEKWTAEFIDVHGKFEEENTKHILLELIQKESGCDAIWGRMNLPMRLLDSLGSTALMESILRHGEKIKAVGIKELKAKMEA